MRDLTDPDNPYAGQYHDWDEWAFAKAKDFDRETMRGYYQNETPEGYDVYYLGVDKDGYVLPLAMYKEMNLKWELDPENAPRCQFSLVAGGTMDPEMKTRLDESLYEIEADYAPRFPDWLAGNPPKWAMVLPEGDVVTLGPLGTGHGFQLRQAYNVTREINEPYFAYDQTGNLLAEGKVGEDWWQLFFPDLESVCSKHGVESWAVSSFNGLVVFRDIHTYEIKGVYSYKGDELPTDILNEPPVTALKGYFGAQIEGLHAAQQK